MTNGRPKLRVLQGGRERRVSLGDLEIVVAPAGPPPFELDAVVLEDDTHGVLAAPAEILPSPEDIQDIVRHMREASPLLPGSVVPRAGTPLCLHAVVHDLDTDPSWSDLWVVQALHSVMVVVRERRIRALGIPLLGTVHGKMPAARSVELLLQVLREADRGPLSRLWVLAPRALADEVASRLSEVGEASPASQ